MIITLIAFGAALAIMGALTVNRATDPPAAFAGMAVLVAGTLITGFGIGLLVLL